jgi:hypothetical protein
MSALIVTYIIGYIVMLSYLIINDYKCKKQFYEYKRSGTFKCDVSIVTLEDFAGNAMISILWFCILSVLILRFLIKQYISFLIKMYKKYDLKKEKSEL